MRIAILTQPLRYNIGGLLQNYALQQVLIRLGHKPVTLDPDPYRHVSCGIIFKRIILKLFGRINKIFIEREINRKPYILGKYTEQFIKKYIKIKRYDFNEQNKLLNHNAYIIGSDQVWRPKYNRGRLDNMFLDFTEGRSVKRIAYAASFGTDEWEFTEDQRQLYSLLLKKFDAISVREKSAVQICKEKFDVEVVFVLDPTLLLEKNDYIEIIKKEKESKSVGDLLVYFLDDSEDKQLLVNTVANDYSLKSFYVNNQIYKKDIVPQIPVSKWLRGFYDAKCVITDSFHACVFAIIFNKPFILYANMERGFSRYQSLFDSLGIKNCMVFNSEEYNCMPIFDYEQINNKLHILQFNSIHFLKHALEN